MTAQGVISPRASARALPIERPTPRRLAPALDAAGLPARARRHAGLARRDRRDAADRAGAEAWENGLDGVCSSPTRRQMLDDIGALDDLHHAETGDPEILTRVAQYELAYRMQQSVPELTDLTREPQSIIDMYGPDVHKPGSYAANCLLARRLAERGVRFIQLYHMGWDQHGDLPNQIRSQCHDTDQASAALIKDLKQRGLLEDTLVIWGGEFGRTIYSQGQLTATNYGRDHHPRCFTIWLAGGGIKPGLVHGETDDFSYNIVKDPVEVYDLNATILHLLGIEHTRSDLSLPGPRLPPDGRARQGRQADPRLKQPDRSDGDRPPRENRQG